MRVCLFTARGRGLAELAGTPEGSPGPAASPAPAPARDALPGLGEHLPGESAASPRSRRGAKGSAGWGTGAQGVGKGASLPRLLPSSGRSSPGCSSETSSPRQELLSRCLWGLPAPRALTNSSLWVPALTKITDFITSPENGHCPPPQSSVWLLAQPWLWAGLGWRSHWL